MLLILVEACIDLEKLLFYRPLIGGPGILGVPNPRCPLQYTNGCLYKLAVSRRQNAPSFQRQIPEKKGN